MAALPQSNTLGWSHKVLAPIAVLTEWILITIEGWRERFRLRHELNDLRFDGELDRTLANGLISPFDVPRLVKVHPGGRDGRRCRGTAAPVYARGVARDGAWLPRMHELAAVSAVARRKFA